MGGAIARGIAQCDSSIGLTVCSPNRHGELDMLKSQYSSIKTSIDNATAAQDSDIVIIAVKPWLLDGVINEINGHIDYSHQAIASVVAGVELSYIEKLTGSSQPALFRIIPNIAIAIRQSMTFITARNTSDSQIKAICDIFGMLGKVMMIEERLMGAGTALASCGIAYAMRYVRAAMVGGIEIGFTPQQSLDIVLQTLTGAATMLTESKEHPETAIDKVTTAGGLTIKGLNVMERNGFTSAIIEGLKASIAK